MNNNIDIYKRIKGINDINDVVKYFLSTLLITNRGWGFYVDWDKVLDFVEKYKIELGILEAVLQSDVKEFFETIKKYPEVIRVFPRLLAIRDDKFSIIENPDTRRYLNFDFTKLPETDIEIYEYIDFWRKSGLATVLKEVKNLRDYYMGVEVGSDTNARKNRGGVEWEKFVEPLIMQIAYKNGYQVKIRQKFEKVLRDLSFKEPPMELRRNMDFIVYKGGKFVDIEANFFSGGGTKLEVPGAYVNRTFSQGFTLSLFLFTDGFGWMSAKSLMQDYFNKFPCIVNYKMAKEGVLEAGLKQVLG
jgi:type II restriction enzyme